MLFSRVFRVLSDSLRYLCVDFLTVNIDEKSCYFRVFFACFLIACKSGVLIFPCYAERRVLVHYDLPKTLKKPVCKTVFHRPSMGKGCGTRFIESITALQGAIVVLSRHQQFGNGTNRSIEEVPPESAGRNEESLKWIAQSVYSTIIDVGGM